MRELSESIASSTLPHSTRFELRVTMLRPRTKVRSTCAIEPVSSKTTAERFSTSPSSLRNCFETSREYARALRNARAYNRAGHDPAWKRIGQVEVRPRNLPHPLGIHVPCNVGDRHVLPDRGAVAAPPKPKPALTFASAGLLLLGCESRSPTT